MIGSIVFNFKYTFHRKAKITVLIYFILIAVFQAIKLNHMFLEYKVNGSLFDYILFTIGGMEHPTTFSFIISWILTMLIVAYISVLVTDSINKLALLSLNRVNNRLKFWIMTCINQLLLSIVMFLISIVIVFIVGLILFGLDLNYSQYTRLFYEKWYSYSFISIIGFIFIIFTSGIYALQMMVQVSLLGFKNRFNLFIAYLMILITTGILHLYGKIPRFFSPLFYPSTLSLSEKDIGSALLLNISISVIAIIIGYLVFRRKDL